MSRRGSVKKAPNGTWYFVVDLPSAGDQRRQVRRRGFATRGEAHAALTELLASLQQGTFVKRADLTLGQYLTDWTEALPATGRGVATVVPRAFDRLVRRSGLPRIRFHDLRVRHEVPCIRAG